MKLTRRNFAGMAAASAATLAMPSLVRAQGAGVNFMSFTYAEDPNRPFVQKVFDDFRTSSGVAVEPIGSAWGDMQRNILLRQRSRTLPVTAQIQDRWLPAIAQMQEIVDLDAVLGKAEMEAALDPSVLAMGRVGGKTVGLPLISGSIGMVANREVMAKAGIANVPTTLAEFRTALIAVRDRVPNSVPYAMATKNPGSVPLDVLLLVWAHGGRMIQDDGKVTMNTPQAQAAMEFIAGLMRDRLVAPEIDRPDARRLFAQGNCAFYIDAPAAKSFARNFSGRGEAADAFVLPMKMPMARAGAAPLSIEWGHIVSMFSTSGVPARDSASARWMRHLIADSVQTTLPLQLGGLPTTKSGRASPGVQNDQFLKNWAAAVGTTMKHEIGIWTNSPELSTILTEETQAALLGQKTSVAAAAALHTRMEASMARRG
jgi:multiple sugar transport system substrate-binding protein